jgi:GT2 family glycosyltransferase
VETGKDFSIVIVQWRTWDLLPDCLRSVAEQRGPSWELWLLDNEGNPCRTRELCQEFPWVQVLCFEANLGFARACNRALPLCQGRYLYFLNPDTRLLGGNVLAAMRKYMEENPKVGIASTRLFSPAGAEEPVACLRYPGQKHLHGELGKLPGQVAAVLGASMVVRREVMDLLKGFDPDFFVYGEDFDLCLRARRLGWEIGVVREAQVLHLGGGSERSSSSEEFWERKLSAEYLFYAKHYFPEAIRAIQREAQCKAAWELFLLTCTRPFHRGRLRTLWKQRCAKYRAIWRWAKSKRFLCRSGPADAVP